MVEVGILMRSEEMMSMITHCQKKEKTEYQTKSQGVWHRGVAKGRTLILTGLADLLLNPLQPPFLRDLLHADGLAVGEGSKHAGKKPHPLVAITTGQTEDLEHLVGALAGGKRERGGERECVCIIGQVCVGKPQTIL